MTTSSASFFQGNYVEGKAMKEQPLRTKLTGLPSQRCQRYRFQSKKGQRILKRAQEAFPSAWGLSFIPSSCLFEFLRRGFVDANRGHQARFSRSRTRANTSSG